jgi:hypothetical protein
MAACPEGPEGTIRPPLLLASHVGDCCQDGGSVRLTGLLQDHFSFTIEQDERWNALHPVSGGELPANIVHDTQPQHFDLSFQVLCQPIDRGLRQ